MIPDYEELVAKGYDYLPVGGKLVRGKKAESSDSTVLADVLQPAG